MYIHNLQNTKIFYTYILKINKTRTAVCKKFTDFSNCIHFFYILTQKIIEYFKNNVATHKIKYFFNKSTQETFSNI